MKEYKLTDWLPTTKKEAELRGWNELDVANRRLRSEDAYTPDGRHDMRPEYPSIVYTQILKKLYPDVPVVLGGIERWF